MVFNIRNYVFNQCFLVIQFKFLAQQFAKEFDRKDIYLDLECVSFTNAPRFDMSFAHMLLVLVISS